MLSITKTIGIPLREFQFTFCRSAGPGGQNVNKVNTKATLRWPVMRSRSLPEAVKQRFVAKYGRRITKEGDIVISSQRFRDRGRNVADCLNKLRHLVASVVTAPKRRRPTKPGRAAKARRRHEKEALSRKKQMRRRPVSDD